MKNLKPYSDDCFSFYELALNTKESDDLRLRLAKIDAELRESYTKYTEHFEDNNLEKLAPNNAFLPYKADLLSLYNYKFSVVKGLRLSIERAQPQAIRYTCQHCTLTSNESLDHFVPKDEFPEFAMNPFNLLPSCGKCNQYKSYVWRDKSKRTALNLYLDKLPNKQYLFVEINYDKYGEIDFEFYLKKSTGIDDVLFDLIKMHFNNLDLFTRMREKSVPVITELQNSINARLSNLSYNEIAQEIKQAAESNKLAFGQNYWKSIIEIELLDSSPFLRTIGITL